MRTAIRWKLVLSFTTSIIGLGVGAYFFFIKADTTIALAIALASVLSPLEEGAGGFIGWLNLKQYFKKRVLFTLIYNLVFAFAMATAVATTYFYGITFATGLYLLLSAYFLSKGATKIFYLVRSMRTIPKPTKAVDDKETLRYGVHLSLSTILVPIGTSLDGVLLFSLLGPGALAIYSFAILVPEQLKGLITSIGGAIEPKILSKSNDSLKLLPMKILRASIPVFVGVALYLLLAPYLYGFLYPRYMDSVFFSQIFALALLAIPFSTGLDHALKSKGLVKYMYFEKLSTQIVQIASLAVLIPFFGILGAVLAKLLTRTYNAVLIIYLIRK